MPSKTAAECTNLAVGRHLLPAVGCRVINIHTIRGYNVIIRIPNVATTYVDLTLNHSCGVKRAGQAEARHPIPRKNVKI